MTLLAKTGPAGVALAAIGVGGPTTGNVEIDANGEIAPFSASGTKVYSFEGLSFRAATC